MVGPHHAGIVDIKHPHWALKPTQDVEHSVVQRTTPQARLMHSKERTGVVNLASLLRNLERERCRFRQVGG